MFRRRREASFRPPASSAWWPAGADPDGADPAERVPALPAGDPFGGWPAFPTDGPDPIDPVLGQPDPAIGWGAPAGPPTPRPGASGSFPTPPPGSYPTPPGSFAAPPGPFPAPPSGAFPGQPPAGQAGPTTGHAAPNGRPTSNAYRTAEGHTGGQPATNGRTGRPGHTGGQPAVPIGPNGPAAGGGQHGGGDRAGGPHAAEGHTGGQPAVPTGPPGPVAAAGSATGLADQAAGPGGAEAAQGATPSWLPLLTHADDDQRCQANPEDAADGASAAERTGLHLVGSDEPGRESRRVRSARRRAGKARRASSDVPEAAASPESATVAPLDRPAPEQLRDLAFANGATTWLDPVAPINPMEAAALAGAFAADYLSWDEASPNRRGQVLMQYLPSDVVGSATSAALLGWSGKGRQRAEFSLPGAVHPDGDGRVVVDVRVRVTPYRAVGQAGDPAPAGDLEVAGVPAVAPAPTARGWKSLDSYWVRMTVPIIRDRGRLVVDTWDEQLNEDDDPAASDDEQESDDELDGAEDVAGALDPGTVRAAGSSDRAATEAASAELAGGGR